MYRHLTFHKDIAVYAQLHLDYKTAFSGTETVIGQSEGYMRLTRGERIDNVKEKNSYYYPDF